MAGQWSFRDSFMIYALLNCYCILIRFRYNLVDNNNAQLRATNQNDCKCNTYANKSFIKPEQLLIARNVTFFQLFYSISDCCLSFYARGRLNEYQRTRIICMLLLHFQAFRVRIHHCDKNSAATRAHST